MEEDVEYGWAVVVEILLLTDIVYDYVLDFTHAVDALEAHKEDDQGQCGARCGQRLQDDVPLKLHRWILNSPVVHCCGSNHLREGDDGEEEEKLLHEHVAKVVWLDLVKDRVAVSEADAVISLTL